MSADPTPIEAIPVEPQPKKHKRKSLEDMGIPRQSFRRLVQSIANDIRPDIRFQQDATDAMQEAAEELLTKRFMHCSELALLCKMDTVREGHWRFVHELEGGGART